MTYDPNPKFQKALFMVQHLKEEPGGANITVRECRDRLMTYLTNYDITRDEYVKLQHLLELNQMDTMDIE